MLTILLTVALLHWLVLITPGANILLISQLAASGHRSSACYASVGISVVAVTWALLAIFGVQSLFAMHPGLRLAMQIMGGLYLCHVAFKLWHVGSLPGANPSGQIAPWAAFRLGLLTNITNPKAALFFGSVFVAALPVDPDMPLLPAVAMLVFANALVWHIFLALALSHRVVQAGYARQHKLLSRVCASIVGAYGLRLLVAAANESRTR